MRVRESHDFHGGYVAQRLKLYASMTAQDLLRLYSKSQVGRGWDAPIQQPFPCEARPGPASPAVMSDHHRRVSSSKHPSPSTIPLQSATVAKSNDLLREWSGHKLTGFHHTHNLVPISQHLDPSKGVSFQDHEIRFHSFGQRSD